MVKIRWKESPSGSLLRLFRNSNSQRKWSSMKIKGKCTFRPEKKERPGCFVDVDHVAVPTWNLNINLLFSDCWTEWILGKINSVVF